MFNNYINRYRSKIINKSLPRLVAALQQKFYDIIVLAISELPIAAWMIYSSNNGYFFGILAFCVHARTCIVATPTRPRFDCAQVISYLTRSFHVLGKVWWTVIMQLFIEAILLFCTVKLLLWDTILTGRCMLQVGFSFVIRSCSHV